MSRAVFTRFHLRERIRDRDAAVYGILLIAALLFPIIDIYATGGTADVSQATRAGYFVLLAIGLNVVVGFAGLLDLGYAAFFAIGAYTYALLASPQLASSPALSRSGTIGVSSRSARAASSFARVSAGVASGRLWYPRSRASSSSWRPGPVFGSW